MTPTIELSGLTKSFGGVRAVDDVSSVVEAGKVTAFLGPNGAGKTTTLRMLLQRTTRGRRSRNRCASTASTHARRRTAESEAR